MTEQYCSFVSVCVAKSSIGIFRCDFSIWIFFSKVIQKSNCYWVLVQVCTAPMLSKSEKILMILNSKQKRLYQLATAELFPNETWKQQKLQKRVWVWCLRLVVFSLCNHTKPYFLAWWSLIAQAKGRRPCVVSNISTVAISVGLPEAVNNPFPASQVGFQQLRAI